MKILLIVFAVLASAYSVDYTGYEYGGYKGSDLVNSKGAVIPYNIYASVCVEPAQPTTAELTHDKRGSCNKHETVKYTIFRQVAAYCDKILNIEETMDAVKKMPNTMPTTEIHLPWYSGSVTKYVDPLFMKHSYSHGAYRKRSYFGYGNDYGDIIIEAENKNALLHAEWKITYCRPLPMLNYGSSYARRSGSTDCPDGQFKDYEMIKIVIDSGYAYDLIKSEYSLYMDYYCPWNVYAKAARPAQVSYAYLATGVGSNIPYGFSDGGYAGNSGGYGFNMGGSDWHKY